MRQQSDKPLPSAGYAAVPVDSRIVFGNARISDRATRQDCNGHADARDRKRQTERRLRWIQSLFDDPARFEAVVASGRYLKLCSLLEWATAIDEVAGWRLDRLSDKPLASLLV